MTTPMDILLQSLKIAGIIGVGQTADAEDLNDAFHQLQNLVNQWQRKRYLVWSLVTTGLTSTGAQSYSVGLGGDYNIARPDRLESAFLRQLINSNPNQVDYTLDILESREDYNRITLKQLTSMPFCIFYDSSYPLGRIYPWPIPQSGQYAVHITTKTQFPAFNSLGQTIDMPPEYIPALEWNLAQRLRILYRLPKDQALDEMARDSLNLIRNANTQIPVLQMPNDVIPTHGIYNIFSDRPN